MIEYENLAKLNKPLFEEFQNAFIHTLESGRYILGEQVILFETEFAQYHNHLFCTGVASGLDALIMGLSVFNFPKKSKVLVPANTYIASILAIIRAGLIPVLVEPNKNTCLIDVEELSRKYDSDCVAIMPVHLYGRMCDMPQIMEFATARNLKVIEDCSQAHFAEINGIKAGCFGDIGAFSFYPTKNLGALGDAGAIICKDIMVFEKLKALRNYGSEKKYENKFIGWNSRLDEMQASFLRIKLKHLQSITDHKRYLASVYMQKLKNISQIQLPEIAGSNHVWHIFNILTDTRNELKIFLSQNGIETEIHYPIAPHKQEAYKELFKDSVFPVSENIHRTTLSLPISWFHTEKDVLLISDTINEYFVRLNNS
ncbi:MAG: DegT/DnrJ/EryC1/StrS family aminotransferase [Bacteroidota bacterium]|nr:DegT/DnrJ/EryC1/StrS family aminotransferase [Bacteroidota bacterium]